MINSTFVFSFGLAALSGFAMVAPTDASATASTNYRTYSPVSCASITGSTTGSKAINSGVAATVETDGQLQNNTSGGLFYFCPVIADNTLAWPGTSGTGVAVSNWATAPNGVYVQDCRAPASGGGGVCGVGKGSTTGANTISFVVGSEWTDAGAFDSFTLLVDFGPTDALFAYTIQTPLTGGV